MWGHVNMMEDIQGNLGGTITGSFSRGPNIQGRFTLSLDQRQLVIGYDFAVKFVGQVSDKISLFSLPQRVLFPNSI
jgi:hypothetical protein